MSYVERNSCRPEKLVGSLHGALLAGAFQRLQSFNPPRKTLDKEQKKHRGRLDARASDAVCLRQLTARIKDSPR